MRFTRQRYYRITTSEKSDVGTVDELAKIFNISRETIMTYSKYGGNGKYRIEKTDLYAYIAHMTDDDVIPFNPIRKMKEHEEKEQPYFDFIVMMLKDRKETRVALGINEKNPAQYLPKLYEMGFDCKVNTYVDPSIKTTHRKPKEYYSIEVVNYV